MGYLCANFSLPRPLSSRVRPDVRDRQTSDAHHSGKKPTQDSILGSRELTFGVSAEQQVDDILLGVDCSSICDVKHTDSLRDYTNKSMF